MKRTIILLPVLLLCFQAFSQKKIAITLDDPNTYPSVKLSWQERNTAILQTLSKHKIKAALFVCGMRVDDTNGKTLLTAWDSAGHLICNHSYSHLYYNSKAISAEKYIADFRRGDAVIRSFSHYTKLFRFPFLKEGNTAEKIDSMRAALKDAGYRTGHVSVDASDWYIDAEMIKALTADAATDLRPYRDYYVQHILNRAAYYDSLAQQVYKKPVKHTLLLHHSLLNALFLDDVINALKQHGWVLVDAGKAFADPLFNEQPHNIPSGESIIWQLAKENVKTAGSLRYPAEDEEYEKVPLEQFIRKYTSHK
ncbi:polysaccharide deacetylase [Chitinophaga dinghuensis]|uniref:Polysaccharide deacetylase n=1 Tax=Chitinophaga dinghuensis TaxID=1539050 RepID=A0A327WCM6_9BACT|nr:polysaccharide deacetylase family protein [Chitinophaga dinghuensis]RAJ88275.1 polysaccharide deacetylase [Chitinophaga dinghuensis]